MEEGRRGFQDILTYSGNCSTPIPSIPLQSTNSQTNPWNVHASVKEQKRSTLIFCLVRRIQGYQSIDQQ
jgi:hypothetical protein